MSNKIKELRESHKMKQIDLAKFLNVSQGTLSNWERGVHDPDNETLICIAEKFNVTSDYVLGRTNNLTSPNTKEKVPAQAEAKDDVGELLDNILQMLGTDSSISFNGKPMSNEAKELLLASLESNIKLADKISAMRQKKAEDEQE